MGPNHSSQSESLHTRQWIHLVMSGFIALGIVCRSSHRFRFLSIRLRITPRDKLATYPRLHSFKITKSKSNRLSNFMILRPNFKLQGRSGGGFVGNRTCFYLQRYCGCMDKTRTAYRLRKSDLWTLHRTGNNTLDVNVKGSFRLLDETALH